MSINRRFYILINYFYDLEGCLVWSIQNSSTPPTPKIIYQTCRAPEDPARKKGGAGEKVHLFSGVPQEVLQKALLRTSL
jgi:hypothetical protein